jgi:hypothetical protein
MRGVSGALGTFLGEFLAHGSEHKNQEMCRNKAVLLPWSYLVQSAVFFSFSLGSSEHGGGSSPPKIDQSDME